MKTALLVLLWVSSMVLAAAQSGAPPAVSPAPAGPRYPVFAIRGRVDTSKYAGLSRLPGRYPFAVHYSSGYKADARAAAEKTARAYAFLARQTGTYPTVGLLVVSAAQWPAHSFIPIPGLPHNRAGNLVVEAGTSTLNRTIGHEFDAVISQHAALMRPYRNAQGELDVTAHMRLVSTHELGHAFHRDQAAGQVRNWLGELFGDVCLQAFTEAEDHTNLALLNDVMTVAALADGRLFPFNTLAQFEHSPVMQHAANYGWYQAQLQTAARRITAAAGPAITGTFFAFLQRHQDPHEFPTDAELARALSREVHPSVAAVITDWPCPEVPQRERHATEKK